MSRHTEYAQQVAGRLKEETIDDATVLDIESVQRIIITILLSHNELRRTSALWRTHVNN